MPGYGSSAEALQRGKPASASEDPRMPASERTDSECNGRHDHRGDRERRHGSNGSSDPRSHKPSKHARSHTSGKPRERPEPFPSRAPPWLRESVRVRVVDKQIAGGALYLKKGTVLTVTTPHECVLQLDGGGVREVRLRACYHVCVQIVNMFTFS